MWLTLLYQPSLESPSSGRPQHRQYVVHLNSEHRKSCFKKLPLSRWVDDDLVDQCQFVRFVKPGGAVSRCPVQFSFFRRRHHCRRYVLLLARNCSFDLLLSFLSVAAVRSFAMSTAPIKYFCSNLKKYQEYNHLQANGAGFAINAFLIWCPLPLVPIRHSICNNLSHSL
jgi:hypothetical protein